MENMGMYRIICTRQIPVAQPHNHAHISQVGTGDENAYSRLWTVAEVDAAMDAGDSFYTIGAKSGETAVVYKYQCFCGLWTLRSAHDDVRDNNLDSLPTCGN
jgi:hypothetical protein